MKKIGLIPLRKNSKGIPGKNKKKMLGRPLFSWVLSEAICVSWGVCSNVGMFMIELNG